jgi:hypothetical protein
MHRRFPCVALFLATTAAAQVAPGDIGITGFSAASFGVATAPAVTGYTTAGFGGIGSNASQSILHDLSNYNDFLIGGIGFIGRATITGPGAVGYTIVTNGIDTATQMSWDWFGNIIVADGGNQDQIRSVTPAGVVTDLSIGVQPWGTSLNAGAFEFATGDVIVGASDALYRLPFGSTTGVPFVSGLGGIVSGITFDPCTGDVIATVLTSQRVVRVTSAGVVTDLVAPLTITQPNAIDIDADGNYLIASTTARVFRLDHTGTAILHVTNVSPATGSTSGVSVAKGGGFATPYGARCAATAGPSTLTPSGSYFPGGTVTTTSVNHVPFAIGIWAASVVMLPGIPIDGVFGTNNCLLHVSPDVLITIFADGAGQMPFSLATDLTYAGLRFFVQHAALEPAVQGGWSFSNGVCIQL